MSATPSSLEIGIHLTSGVIERFVQTDPAVIEDILTNAHPQKVLQQRHFIIAGNASMAVYLCSAITHLELIMDGYPEWPFPLGVEDILQITEPEFLKRTGSRPAGFDARRQPPKAHETIVGHADIGFVSGDHLFIELVAKLSPKIDQYYLMSQLFAAPGLYSRRPDGGVCIANPANIVRFTIHLGSLQMPKTAWSAVPKAD